MIDVKLRYSAVTGELVMNLQIVIYRRTDVYSLERDPGWASSCCERCSRCLGVQWVMFPWRARRSTQSVAGSYILTLQGEHMCLGRYHWLRILSAALHRFILLPWRRGCAVFPQKIFLSIFMASLCVVKPPPVFIHLLKGGRMPRWVRKMNHAMRALNSAACKQLF